MTTPDYSNKYLQLYDFHRSSSIPTTPQETIVFGRKDPLVSHALGDLILASLVDTVVITGGLGKDSGDIVALGYESEASYLHQKLTEDASTRGYTNMIPTIFLDENATNGGENVRNSREIFRKLRSPLTSFTAVAHATSARRLAEMIRHEIGQSEGNIPTVYVKPTDYKFDSSNPADQAEAVAEFKRLIEWPAKGWLDPQSDLPNDLQDFVLDQDKDK